MSPCRGTPKRCTSFLNWQFISCQGPIHPKTNAIPNAFEDQVRQTLTNIEIILDAAGASLRDVVKINTYLADLATFETYNDVYREFFPVLPPARTTIGTALLGISIEIDCIALLPQ